MSRLQAQIDQSDETFAQLWRHQCRVAIFAAFESGTWLCLTIFFGSALAGMVAAIFIASLIIKCRAACERRLIADVVQRVRRRVVECGGTQTISISNAVALYEAGIGR